jgi:hypothetical protein
VIFQAGFTRPVEPVQDVSSANLQGVRGNT